MSELRDATQGDVEDATLLERMTQGDERALSELFDRYAPLVSSFAMTMVGSSDEADEVIYDVFTQSWSRAGEYSRAHGNVAAWLIQFARKRIAAAFRSREERGMTSASSTPEVFAVGQETPGAASAESTARSLSGPAVAAIRNLDQQTRTILLRACFNGLGEVQLAEEFHLSTGEIRAAMVKGLSSLSTSMGEKL